VATTLLEAGKLNLDIGLLRNASCTPAPVWAWYCNRLGNVIWEQASDPGEGKGAWGALDHLLKSSPPHVVLVDVGVRLLPNSPIWSSEGLLLVVSLSPWRVSPPRSRWTTSHTTLSHQDVGGVTNGSFEVFFARHFDLKEDIEFRRREAAPAKLRHVLDPTVSGGIKCGIPSNDSVPLGQSMDGLLHWGRRFHNVESPTVFSKTQWVRRRLTSKELVSVLDLPVDRMKDIDRDLLVRKLAVPGKVRARVMEEVREWIAPQLACLKRPLVRTFAEAPRKRPKLEPWGLSEQASTAMDKRHDLAGLAESTVTTKAAKADDAAVPVYLWNNQCYRGINMEGLDSTAVDAAFDVIRRGILLRRWKKNVGRDFRRWIMRMDADDAWKDSADRAASLRAGGKALFYSSQTSWWEWDAGSFPFFWRWEPMFMREVRDGMPPRFRHEPPSCMDPQRPNPNPEFAKKERAKVLKVIQRGYLITVLLGAIRSLMHYFSVSKGDNDIRMVYDGSKCKLNAATFAPWFAVPTASSLERTVMPYTVQGDNDFADMFLNFQLHEEMQRYTGVDISDLLRDEVTLHELRKVSSNEDVYVTWDRPAMGLTGSPYQAVQTATRGKRIILGDHTNPYNPFRWDEVIINAPGCYEYNPTLPWIYKLRQEDGLIAADLHTYIDDNRATANSDDEAWMASSRIAKTCSWLGMQDAARKRRAPSMTPGAWAGTVIHTDGKKVEKMVSEERWEKTRSRIRWIDRQLTNDPGDDDVDHNCPVGHLPHKRLESIRGFLVYVSRTYPEMVPLLKGIHLTLDSWRQGRAASGWKREVDIDEDEDFDGCYLTNTIDSRLVPLEVRMRDSENPDAKPPKYVRAVPRLSQDLGTLIKLTTPDKPPPVLVRPTNTIIGYLVGDASGSGHGTSFLSTHEETISLSHGAWSEVASKRSSNFRELGNLVRRVEQLVKEGRIKRGTELFIFTDNFVTESVFYKGAARSPYLHDLVERLRMLQLHGGLFVHMLWIAGTRMIDQGTDGLSRGDFSSGVMAGKDFLSFLPLDKSALDLSPKLAEWIGETLPGRHAWRTLSPKGWYTEGHGDGHFLWAPPPAVADAVLEQLCEAALCRPWNAHVFVCPAHMTYKWRKQLRKVADLVVTIPVGGELWPKENHEPLVFALICPFLAYSPWRVKGTPRLVGGQNPLPKVWSPDWSAERNILRKLWIQEVPSDTDLLWGLAPRVLPKRPLG
jgi:hypothetical protein